MSSGDAQRVELAIERLAVGGDGVGRDATGRVFFVPLTAPGDRVRARVTELHRRYGRAELEQLHAASPLRSDPRCPAFGRCGGCSWQHLEYAAQVAAKRSFLLECLQRIGGVADIPEIEFLPSPDCYGYRGRARILGGETGVGFRARASHRICRVDACPVLAPPLEEALRERAAAAPGADATENEALREYELTLGSAGRVRWVASRAAAAPPPDTSLEICAGADRLRVSPGVFVQANTLLLPSLVDAVEEAAGSGGAALELYAGAGFLSVRLARRFSTLKCVEASAPACDDLRHNLTRAGAAGVAVVCAPVRPTPLRKWLRELRPEVVVLDPPRAGLGTRGAQLVAEAAPRRVVYLACDPATWARDLAAFCRSGYQLRRVVGLDLFPQTPHVEALGVLEPGDPPPRS